FGQMHNAAGRVAGPCRSLLLRGALASFGCLVALAASAPNAAAHASFLGPSPEPGARVHSGPPAVTLRFIEPLNRALSKASLVNARTGARIPASVQASGQRREIVLRPETTLPRAPYRVQWHTVSTVDGHALEGSFSFGVRTAAVGGGREIEQSALARNGWVRIAFRSLLYASLLFFAGGLINAALLSRRGRPMAWLVPEEVRSPLGAGGVKAETLADKAWARTLDAGFLAAAAAVAVAVAQGVDAAGRLSANGLS